VPPVGAFPPPGVTLVVFDVVGTLVEPAPSVARIYRDTAAAHGVEREEEEIRRAFAAAWRRQEGIDAAATPPHATSPQRERQRWEAIVADVFPGVTAAPRIFADLWEHFGRPAAWRALPRGEALVAASLAAGVDIALGSNFDERLLSIAPCVSPLMAARHVFTSAELGWRKPAVAFFRAIETRVGRQPEELLLVGDDPLLDLAAARAAGWRVHGVVE